jgi:DNA-binding transcriptional ArsR family regulator
MTMRASAARVNRADALADDQFSFLNDFGQLFARYGASFTLGRVFALLLISDEPISLDDLAEQLQVSKSAVSVATRDLERVGIARRLSRPGSRRVLYEAGDDMLPIFEAQFTRIHQSLAILHAADAWVSRGRASRRLREMEALHEFWLAESQGIIERWRRRRKLTR